MNPLAFVPDVTELNRIPYCACDQYVGSGVKDCTCGSVNGVGISIEP